MYPVVIPQALTMGLIDDMKADITEQRVPQLVSREEYSIVLLKECKMWMQD